MGVLSKIQRIVGKLTNKHCYECGNSLGTKCTRLDKKGELCRKGIYPIGYIKK